MMHRLVSIGVVLLVAVTINVAWAIFVNHTLARLRRHYSEDDIVAIMQPDGGWFITPDAPQGAPIDGRVLIGQFGSNDLTEGTGNSIRGTFLIQAVSDGDPGFQTMASFFHGVPAPGALALLGLAGIGRRRRR